MPKRVHVLSRPTGGKTRESGANKSGALTAVSASGGNSAQIHPHRHPSGEAFPPHARTTCERASDLRLRGGKRRRYPQLFNLREAPPWGPALGNRGPGIHAAARATASSTAIAPASVAVSFGPMPDSGAARTCVAALARSSWALLFGNLRSRRPSRTPMMTGLRGCRRLSMHAKPAPTTRGSTSYAKM